VQTRRLGRTGHHSSLAILGGAAFWGCEPDVAAASFHAALDAGVNHLDIAPRYGRAQELLGPLVPAVRDRLFVACKTTRANPAGFRAQLEESLALLGCDSFDLYQLHGVTDLEVLDARSDAARELIRARDEGLCRWIGVTGHNLGAPAAHLEALRRYDLDTVMFPVNPRLWADPVYRGDAEALLAHADEHDVGVMAIKAAAARPWSEGPRHSQTWYEPYTGGAELESGVRFTLSVPGVHALCTPGDLDVLSSVLGLVEAFEPLDNDGRRAAAAVAHEEHIFPMPRG
jgi:aryl-alcohol dehydrogenase-like predicted oxidoreductase